MNLHSTKGTSHAPFKEGIMSALAPDGGLWMPDALPKLPGALFRNMSEMTLNEIGYVVLNTLFGGNGGLLDSAGIKTLVDKALTFPIPLHKLTSNISVMELFHGPTRSFKDVGARFMAHLLPMIEPGVKNRTLLLATTGDCGAAMANAFRNHPSTKVVILFPKNELSRNQLAQFAAQYNVKAIEVDGTFDDCQKLVVEALSANAALPHKLIGGNSLNLARELPLIIYYFHTYARLVEEFGTKVEMVISVPCGNLGNLTAALMAKKMGLPVKRILAVNNANDSFVNFLNTGEISSDKRLSTIAEAMDVCRPLNLERVNDLYGGDRKALNSDVAGFSFADEEIAATMRDTLANYDYFIDPHGATALRALKENIGANEVGVALACAHPAKYSPTIQEITGRTIELPPDMADLNSLPLRITKIPATFVALRRALLMH